MVILFSLSFPKLKAKRMVITYQLSTLLYITPASLSLPSLSLHVKIRQKFHKMDQENLPPHVVIFPFPLQGPGNSMFKLAELLCLSGFHITILVTDHIYKRLARYTNIQSRCNRYTGFQIETISDGLPEDHPRKGDQFMEILDSLKTKTKPLFKELLTSGNLAALNRRPVTCIIADGIMGFTCDVANDVGIPIIYIRTLSCCCLWVFFCLPQLLEAGELPFNDNDLDKLVTSVPGTEDFLRRRDLPSFCRLKDSPNIYVELCKTESHENARAFGLILNTFEELEGPIPEKMRSICPNLYPIGPLHAHLKTRLAAEVGTASEQTSSNSLWEEDNSCITWLDKQSPRSVLYVSFGSIATVTKDQLLEFWYGLINSGVRFLWVMRPDLVAGKDWEENVPDEITEGTKQRGYIVGWAPQEKVLAHQAIGGFWTHSGWNSTLESICEGIPMICWPYFMDQQVNSRFVEAFWKLGLDMKDTCDKVVVAKLVRELMVDRKEEFLKRADDLAKLAKGCLSEGGSSFDNLKRLVKDIESLAAKDKSN